MKKSISKEINNNLISIFKKACDGGLTLESLDSEWAIIPKSAFIDVLYQDIKEAISHLPTKNLTSDDIDYQYWRGQHEYSLMSADLVLLKSFDDPDLILKVRKIVSEKIFEYNEESIVELGSKLKD